MKTLRRLSFALVFTLALTIPALAGEIHTTVTSQQQPPAQSATTGGDIQIPIAGQEETGDSEATTADSVTESVLNLLQSVLSLF